MRIRAFAGFLLILLPLSAQAQGLDRALEDFQMEFKSTAFSGSRLSPQNQLVLQATDFFLSANTARQKILVGEAFTSWRKALGQTGEALPSSFIEVVWPAGGSLWSYQEGGVQKMEEWSDEGLFLGEAAGSQRGRLFGFFGGQLSTGGDADLTGFNAKFGSTLFKNRYDLALTFGYTSIDTVPKTTSVSSYGLSGRALFPLTRHAGWNLGGQILRTNSSQGNADNTFSLLGGINLYIPGGSFDVTLTLGNEGNFGLLLGYTLYLTRR